jgi:hypothetical protein
MIFGVCKSTPPTSPVSAIAPITFLARAPWFFKIDRFRVNRSSIARLAARRQGIARYAALHRDCARSARGSRDGFVHESFKPSCRDRDTSPARIVPNWIDLPHHNDAF